MYVFTSANYLQDYFVEKSIELILGWYKVTN